MKATMKASPEQLGNGEGPVEDLQGEGPEGAVGADHHLRAPPAVAAASSRARNGRRPRPGLPKDPQGG